MWWRTSTTCWWRARCLRCSPASITGRRNGPASCYNERHGQIHFWNSLISFNVTFFPMHFLGLAGMPRRYADYPAQFTDWNVVASIGAFWFGLSQVYFLFAVVLPMIKGGKPAPAKPWEGADGLEWTVPSPAPFHTFEVPPIVK